MAQRLLRILVPNELNPGVRGVLNTNDSTWTWSQEDRSSTQFEVLATPRQAEEIMELLGPLFERTGEGRLFVVPLQATLPVAPDPDEETPQEDARSLENVSIVERRTKKEERRGLPRVSRHELLQHLGEFFQVSPLYIVNIVLSTLVAVVGLARDNGAVIIGAMVIAPLLGPNMALALATTLGDHRLAYRAARVGLAGAVFSALTAAIVSPLPFLAVDRSIGEVAFRTVADPADVLLALASGAAGALAMTSAAASSLVGVMVAVALLPPLATAVLLACNGDAAGAGGALLLLLVNVISVNLAAVAVFLLRGIRPGAGTRLEARRLSSVAVGLWLVLLATVAVLTLLQS